MGESSAPAPAVLESPSTTMRCAHQTGLEEGCEAKNRRRRKTPGIRYQAGGVNAFLVQLRNAIDRLVHQWPGRVPLMIKELILHAKGVRCDSGSRLAQGFVAEADTEPMARFRRAGLLLTATMQTPELGNNPTTEAVLHGPVRNPWDLGRSAGGSSGGSGAAVAAGIVPIAHARDGGGSIQIPASANGSSRARDDAQASTRSRPSRSPSTRTGSGTPPSISTRRWDTRT